MARITFSTAIVLQAIAAGYRYGFDIMEATGLPSGTVYPALRRLDRDGFLSSSWEDKNVATEDQRPPRRYYEVSGNGQLALSDARAKFHGLERAVPDATDGGRPGGAA
jgi:DNA-binding PadR family transcriptional regulator